MRTLNRKVLRETWKIRMQALAIAFVIGGGTATFVMSATTLTSLTLSQQLYYADYNFADVFASLKRAPDRLLSSVKSISGVREVKARVTGSAKLEIKDFDESVVARLVSIDDNAPNDLNRLYLKQGRLPHPAKEHEVVISEALAEAHQLQLEQTFFAVLNERRKKLTVVGIALSPEFIYEIGPGMLMPDYKRYGILWMSRNSMNAAFDMDGSFNDVILTLTRNAASQDVIQRLDQLLQRYGGVGAIARKDQISHHYLTEELAQLKRTATIFPLVFLSVSAFLLNVVIGRVIATQREQIAVLKAFGYTNQQVSLHYLKFVSLIVVAGILIGLLAGVWLGRSLSTLFMDFYRLPFLEYRLQLWVVIVASAVCLTAGLVGTLRSIANASRLPPAEAMRPEAPVTYQKTILERLGLGQSLSQPSRMILRHLERNPGKSVLTVIGIAFAYAMMMVGSFQEDAVDHMLYVEYGLSSRQDMTVAFVEPTPKRAIFELQNLSGVEYAFPYRSVAVRLRHGHRHRRTGIQGLDANDSLRKILNTQLAPVAIPQEGILLNDWLAESLQADVGDLITVEVLEGRRQVFDVYVAGRTSEYVGMSAYMRRSTLNRMLGEDDLISFAALRVDDAYTHKVIAHLQDAPRVVASTLNVNVVRSFYENFSEMILVFAFINTLLASSIAFGVVYNSARVMVAERARELASLRVLGLSRGEISYIMLGELVLLTLVSLPVGFFIGYGLCASIANGLQSDLYRVPLVLESSTYAFSACVVIAASVISALAVRHRLDHLNLVTVLKSRE